MTSTIRVHRVLGLVASGVMFLALAACQQGTGELSVSRLDPPQGTTAGGEQVSIIGSGFQPGKTQAQVRFGRQKVENVIIASTTKINVITPNGEKGPVDIKVMFDDGKSFVIPGGFKYLEPTVHDTSRKAFFDKAGATKKAGGGVEAVEAKPE